MQTSFKIDGVPIKRPSTFKIERFNLTKSGRVASGDMTMELVSKKRKFFFTYSAISSKDLNVILDAIWNTNKLFYTLEYVENNEVKTATVYVGSIPSDLHHTGSLWTWTNVDFNLIEK